MAATTPTDTCAACALWKRNPDDRMTDLGFGLCPHLPVYRYLAGRAPCAHRPARFVPKDAAHAPAPAY